MWFIQNLACGSRRLHWRRGHPAESTSMSEVVDAALATASKTCDLGTDPSKYLEKFEDWYEHTSLLADSIGVKDKKQKLRLLLLWGGRQFRKFAKVTTEGDTPDTLEQALTKIREQCGTHVTCPWQSSSWCTLVRGRKQLLNSPGNLKNLLHSDSLIPSRTPKPGQWRMPSSLAPQMTSCAKKPWPKILNTPTSWKQPSDMSSPGEPVAP